MNKITSIVILIIMAIGAALFFKVSKDTSRSNKALRSDLKALREDSVAMREYNGRVLSEKLALEVSVNDLKNNHIQEIEDWKNKLDLVKVKNRHIRNISEIVIVATDTGTVPIDSVDSTESKSFEINDGFLEFKGKFADNSLSYEYTYTDSLYMSHVYERKNIFSKPKLNVVAGLSNSSAKVTGIKSISIAPRDPKFVIGVSAGLGIREDLRFTKFVGLTFTVPVFVIYK
jgi:hypothetical protein